MQRAEFEQQLRLDYIHVHPDFGALHLWPLTASAEYLTLVTLNHGPFAAQRLMGTLARMGYRSVGRYAMADKGLLVHLLAPQEGSWLVLAELQLGSLLKHQREALTQLIQQSHPADCKGQNLLCRGRPWPMPSWSLYQQLNDAHPLAAWLAIMGPRLHHAGFDCETLGQRLDELTLSLEGQGVPGRSGVQNGVFAVSPMIDHCFYPAMPQKFAFNEGDEHRLCMGGMALTQKNPATCCERIAEILLPPHTRCEIA